MEFSDFIRLLFKKKQTILFVVILFLIITVAVTFIQPLKYATYAKVLVVQNYSPQTDAYVVSRSNEYLSTVLAKVINTNSFFREVINSSPSINRNYFTSDYNKQVKIWNKTVAAQPINDTGIISLVVYHQDKEQAGRITNAVIATLLAKHKDYHGAGDQVGIRVIDQPITSNLPVKPNIFLNLAAGLFMGLLFSFIFIYLYPEEKYNIESFFHRPKKIEKILLSEYEKKPAVVGSQSLPRPVETKKQPEYLPEVKISPAPVSPGFDDDLDIANRGDMQNIFRQSNLDK